jgi:RsiW-degrading membrane proteinase PrsW (M82 family)
VSSFVAQVLWLDAVHTAVEIAPTVEEAAKLLPLLFYLVVLNPENDDVDLAFIVVAVGFATMESLAILVQNASSVNLAWAPVRGIGSALMHGICTGAVGLGVHFIHEKKRMFVPTALALLLTAMTYHSLYNTLVQSEYRYACVLLPLATLGALYLYRRRVAMLKERRRRELFGAKKTAADGARGQNAA